MTLTGNLRPVVSTTGNTQDFLASLRRLKEASPAEILAVRLIIEPQVAAAAVSNATGADLLAIREAHENAISQRDLTGFENWDNELHRLIYAATRNELLISLNDILGVIRSREPWLKLKKKVINEAKRQEYCAHHEQIVSSIENRNATGAHAAMAEHILVITRDLFP